jgi:hypothetical protein
MIAIIMTEGNDAQTLNLPATLPDDVQSFH